MGPGEYSIMISPYCSVKCSAKYLEEGPLPLKEQEQNCKDSYEEWQHHNAEWYQRNIQQIRRNKHGQDITR